MSAPGSDPAPPAMIRAKFGADFVATNDTYRLGIDARITSRIAERFQGRIVLETCAGAGFTTMALARSAAHVVSVEIDPDHLAQARSNLQRAGLTSKVTLLLGDVMSEAVLEAAAGIDAAFLDPDWANLEPGHVYRFRDSNMRPPADALLSSVFRRTNEVALILPPRLDLTELAELPAHERQTIRLGGEHVLYCVYFGGLMVAEGVSELSV